MALANPIRTLLLDLLSSERSVAPERLGELDPEAWEVACETAAHHRLAPLLHQRCRDAGLEDSLPPDVARRWSNAHRVAAFNALRHRAALARLSDIFTGIDFLALKGLWLAWYAYPDAALRPVRDIDLLVHPDQAMEAFARLLDSGFERLPRYAFDPERAITEQKHLPGLYSPDLGVLVELHVRLLPPGLGDEHPAAWGTPGQLLSEHVSHAAMERTIAYPLPCDTLLHLILHAVYDHRFDNGPLVIHDIVCTVLTGDVDWPRFWTMVDGGAWSRGVALLLDLAEREHGELPIDWCGRTREATPPALLDQAASLMFQDSGKSGLLSNMGKVLGDAPLAVRIGRAASTLRTSSETICSVVGLENEGQRRWWHYFAWLRKRLQQLVAGLGRDDARVDARQAAAVGEWLNAAQ